MGELEVACVHCGGRHPAAFSHCPQTGKHVAAGKALVGRVIQDRYRIVDLIGEGGMGVVYIAEHLLLGRKVALKRLHPELAGDERAMKRFRREARAAAATGHANIVDVLDLGFAEDGAPYLVMELLQGRSLAAAIRSGGPIEPRRACAIVGQVLSALDAVHRSGIIHRDLKPDNVFLARKGRDEIVKVLDFGISKVREEEGELDLTRTGSMLGTPYYMSPEQARGTKELDHRIDLYAAGVILFECLSARLPFESQNYHALMQMILVQPPLSLYSVTPEVDPGLVAIVKRAMARERDERYPDARAMLVALVPYGAADPDPDAWAETEPPSPAARRITEAASGPGTPVPFLAHPPVALGEKPEDWVGPAPGASVPPTRTGEVPPPTGSAQQPKRFLAQSHDWADPLPPLDASLDVKPAPPGRRTRPSSPHAPIDAEQAAVSRSRPSSPHAPIDASPRARKSSPLPPAASVRPGTPRTPMLTKAHVRGSLLIAATQSVVEWHGRGTFGAILAAVPRDQRAHLEGVFLPDAWFPIELFDAFLAATAKVVGARPEEIAADIGAGIAARELGPTATGPDDALARIPELFRAYHNRGEAVLTRTITGEHRVEVHDLDPEPHLHAVAMAGFYRKLLELAGARSPRANVLTSRGRGDPRTVTTLRFD